MKSLIGVINLDHELEELKELTYFRCGAAVPYAGRYRLIDFVLSNMMNAGIESIGVFVRRKYRSLMDHLGDGKPWDLDRRHGGMFILPPDWNDPTDTSQGDLQHFHNNLDFFHRGAGQYIVHAGSRHVTKADLQDVYRHHIRTGADVTLVCKRVNQLLPEHDSCIKVDHDEEGNVVDIHQCADHTNIYTEIFMMEKELFLKQVQRCIEYGETHFFRDAIMKNPSKLKIMAYAYEGYHAVINSIDSYYRNSMDLLNSKQYEELFKEDPVQTKIKYEAPAKYLESADVKHSLLANGCIVAGEVQDSILFRGVHVAKGAKIKGSIIMQKCYIGEGTVLENVILDKDVKLTGGQTLIGAPSNPYILAKSTII